MAKVQTRRSVSIPGKLRDRAKEFGDEHGIPISQMVEQALEAVLAGQVVLVGAKTPLEQRRRTLALAAPVSVAKHPPGEFCALCFHDVAGLPIRREAIGRDDALVNVCCPCATNRIRRAA